MTKVTICDLCEEHIDDKAIPKPMLEVKTYNNVSTDVEGHYCEDCALVVAEAIREVL